MEKQKEERETETSKNIHTPLFIFKISGHLSVSILTSTDGLCGLSAPTDPSPNLHLTPSLPLSHIPFVSLFDNKVQFKVKVKYILVAIQSQTFTYQIQEFNSNQSIIMITF